MDGMGWDGKKSAETDVPFMLCIRLERKNEMNRTGLNRIRRGRSPSLYIQVVLVLVLVGALGLLEEGVRRQRFSTQLDLKPGQR